MNVTRSVIEDLLPVYLAGEVSEDSRRLVEEYLRSDPELAESVRRAAAPLATPEVAPDEHLEFAALDRTRRLLARKSVLLGCGIFLMLTPFAFVFRGNTVTWVMFRDFPAAAAAALVASAAVWVWFLITCSRLQATGLVHPSRSRQGRLRWFAGGLAVGIPVAILLREWAGVTSVGVAVLIALGTLALGERLGQVSPREPRRPLSIRESQDRGR